MPDRHSDEYDPEPDYDRPTRAEAEAEADEHEDEGPCCECGSTQHKCHDCPVFGGPEQEGPTCIICDGVGHNYIVDWHDVPGKGTQPIVAGGTCPLEDPGRYDPRDYDEYDPF